MQPRVESVDAAALERRFDACSTELRERMDPFDYRSWSHYLERAHLAFARGLPAAGVVEDLFSAARCLHECEAMHLGRYEPVRFRTRRVVPLELGLASGHPALMGDLAGALGLSLPLLVEGSDRELAAEVGRMTPWFSHGVCDDLRGLLGLAAVVYAGSLAALARGFDDEAALGLELYGRARSGFGALPKDGKLGRYEALDLALVAIVNRDASALGRHVQAALALHDTTPLTPSPDAAAGDWLDVAAVALLAAGALRGLAAELEAGSPYREFVAVFAAGPRDDALISAEEANRLAERAAALADAASELKAPTQSAISAGAEE